MPRLVGGCALATVTVMLIVASSAYGAFPGRNGQIALGADPDVVALNPDGSGQQDFGQGDTPAYSPDGRTIAFTRGYLGDGSVLFLMKADGTAQTEITWSSGGSSDIDPAWSPDGKTLAFIRCYTQWCGLAKMPAAGGGATYVDDTGDARRPSWSPDGTRIAFDRCSTDSTDTETCGIYIVRPDGTGEHQISAPGSYAIAPDWSPDGKKIVFGNFAEIYTMTSSGGSIKRLTYDGGHTGAAWSPDGKKMAVMLNGGGIAVMNADGSHYTPIASADPPNLRPTWQPLPPPPPPPTPGGGTGPVDSDGDGYTTKVDCNDADPSAHPGAFDFPGDGVDQDCDGADASPPLAPGATSGPIAAPGGPSVGASDVSVLGGPGSDGSVRFGARRLSVRHGKLAIAVRNPNLFAVTGAISVKSAHSVAVIARHARKKVLVLGHRSFQVAAGGRTVVQLALSRKTRRTLRRVHRIRVVIRVRTIGPTGVKHSASRTAVLRLR